VTGIFEEESAEDKAFWENPSGPPAAPAGVDPDEFRACKQWRLRLRQKINRMRAQRKLDRRAASRGGREDSSGTMEPG
jgi:hypothetical protein